MAVGTGRGLGQLAHRLGGDASDDNLVGLLCEAVAAVVVEIEVYVVGILADDAAGELAILQLQRVAGVILQGDVGRGRLLGVEIAVGGVGHQLVAVAVDVEVAFRHLRVLGVEVGLLLGLRAPARGVVGALHLHGNLLGHVVVETHDDGDGTVAAGRLEVAEVVVPLAVVVAGLLTLVEGVGLQVEAVVEVVPRRVGLIAALQVVDDYDLGLVDHFLARGYVHRAVDDAAPHLHPDALEVWRGGPVAAGVAVDIGVGLVEEAFLAPYQLGTVPDGAAVDAGLLHDGADAGRAGIFLAVVLA